MVENVSLSVVVGSTPINSTNKNKLGLYLSGRGQSNGIKAGSTPVQSTKMMYLNKN